MEIYVFCYGICCAHFLFAISLLECLDGFQNTWMFSDEMWQSHQLVQSLIDCCWLNEWCYGRIYEKLMLIFVFFSAISCVFSVCNLVVGVLGWLAKWNECEYDRWLLCFDPVLVKKNKCFFSCQNLPKHYSWYVNASSQGTCLVCLDFFLYFSFFKKIEKRTCSKFISEFCPFQIKLIRLS
jgi:hypothetical protein